MQTAGATLFSFVALYFTTLFSLDTWNAARASAFRAPGANTNTYFRPANPPPSADSYQARYSANGHPRGTDGSNGSNGSNGSGSNGKVGRIPTVRDSRPALKMGVAGGCGSCM
ncbi:hypothetical protein BDV96DRAFT_584986 [Lophiotrema nucula]|uniref:Uncharacterized protein n=1 Tax=Lophiotrema nucula TaxID=690887 RepID=A0A6A5YR14_9PLEO|nr:hypothetical protein BDV96DRAFT_584986 [Lophiotrema nucula]